MTVQAKSISKVHPLDDLRMKNNEAISNFSSVLKNTIESSYLPKYTSI